MKPFQPSYKESTQEKERKINKGLWSKKKGGQHSVPFIPTSSTT